MTEQISIWRWVVEDDLDGLFARLVAATDAGFGEIATEIMRGGEGANPPPSLDEIEAQTEAKMRAQNLPKDILKTVLEGLKEMMREAREEAEKDAADEENDEDFAPDPQGRISVGLASSHMFFDDPYASLEHEEIDRQVAALMTAYKAAASKAVGHEGQSFMAYLGVAPEQFYDDPKFDALEEEGFGNIEWVWVTPEHVYFLNHWHEDKELPIDLEFGRAPVQVFEALQAQFQAGNEI